MHQDPVLFSSVTLIRQRLQCYIPRTSQLGSYFTSPRVVLHLHAMDLGFDFPQRLMIAKIPALYYSRALLCLLFTTRDFGWDDSVKVA